MHSIAVERFTMALTIWRYLSQRRSCEQAALRSPVFRLFFLEAGDRSVSSYPRLRLGTPCTRGSASGDGVPEAPGLVPGMFRLVAQSKNES
jgi:hypothetical protein